MVPSGPLLLHRVIHDAAARSPDAPAFRCEGATLSYADLAGRASALARTLREAGVKRGDRVGLYLDKSLDSAVALFGVMQAGAAYVPLDPAARPERTRAVLQLCGARVVVSHRPRARSAVDALAGAGLIGVVGLEEAPEPGMDAIGWADALGAPPAPATAPDASELDLAYIIFTSGSTGVPKGIMHSHSSGLSYARMARDLYGVMAEDRLSNASPLHFDMSTFDYFCGPLAGATTTIIPDAYLKLPASLTELIAEEQLTIWYSVPFALTQMLHHGEMAAQDLSCLRWVLFGGEPFVPKHLSAVMAALPGARFSNVYGPAEVNQCTWFDLPPAWNPEDGQPPIGLPCRNVDTMVVDDRDVEVADGETGELVVRTPTMMRGYWQRPELNARAFLDKRGTGGATERYYRSGDLVRRDAYGLLRFAGRKDRQIKSRGYRIELDEVEASLAAHPAVAEAAAFAVVHGEGLTLVEAAVTLHEGRRESEDVLKAFAAERLPGYAVPVRIGVAETFPRTTSGKIDRRRLGEEAAAALQEAT